MRISDWSSDVCSSDLRATAQDGVVKLAVAHLAAANQLALQRLQLQATEQITGLIQRRIIAGKAAPDFGGGVVALVADPLHQHLDRLLGRHLAQMEAEREQDAGGAVLDRKSVV